MTSALTSPSSARDTARDQERPLQLGEPIPAVCMLHDVARVMRIAMKTAYRYQAQGLLKRFELPRVGTCRARYSGALLDAWRSKSSTDGFINGEPNRPRSFGRKRV